MAEQEQGIDELLAAYLDGVSELTPEERKRVEARLSELDVDGTRGMIEQLRALPPEGREPDWRAMEKRIAAAVDEVKLPWWRRWFVPVGALVMTAAVAMLWIDRTPDPAAVQPAPHVAIAPAVDAAVPAPVPAAQSTEVWLDGQLVDVGDVDDSALFDDLDAPDTVTAEDDGLLPAGDLGWVDNLDDRALERAEHILEKKKS